MTESDWQVPAAHPAFAGHFPGRPILPGVVLLDRAIALAAARHALDPARLRLASAKFLGTVAPGETLRFALRETASGGTQVEVRSGERAIASMLFTHRPEEEK